MKNNFVKIPVEIVEALSRLNLSPYESRLFHYIERYTHGWHRGAVAFNAAVFAERMNLERPNVYRAIKSLSARRIIVVERNLKGETRLSIERDTALWLERAPVQGAFDFDAAAEEAETYGERG